MAVLFIRPVLKLLFFSQMPIETANILCVLCMFSALRKTRNVHDSIIKTYVKLKT